MKEVELGERDAAKITAHLWRVMKSQGPGTITRVEVAFGLRTGTLYRRKRRAGFRVQQVCAILRFLDYPVPLFFAEALDGSPTSAGDRFRADGSGLIARGVIDVPELASPAHPDVLTSTELDALDRARFEDPKHAADQAREVAFLAGSEGRHGDAAACAARWASALRAAEQWYQAHAIACWAINCAPDGPILADCWLRASSVASDYGSFDDAVELAGVAMLAFVDMGNDFGTGKALVLRGINLRRAGHYAYAIRCLRSALTKTPANERHIHFGIHQNLGLAFVAVGELSAADDHAAAASTLAVAVPSASRYVWWLRARVANARGDLSLAAELYERTAADRRSSPADAALVGAELARVYLKAGRLREAIKTSRDLAALAMPWRANRLVSAAVRDLWCTAREGALTLRVLDNITARIRRARDRRVAIPGSRPTTLST